MGYSHTMIIKAKTAPGTTVEQVAKAFEPIMNYFGFDGVDAFTEAKTVYGDSEFFFDPESGDLEVVTYGEVGNGYIDLVREVAVNLGCIVEEPDEIWLYDHDTGDIDEAKRVIEFGPSEEVIKAYIAKRDIDAGLRLMEPHLSSEKLEVLRRLVSGGAGEASFQGEEMHQETLPWRTIPPGKTAEGWDTHDEDGELVIFPYRGRHIVTVSGSPVCEFVHDEDDARRIVACVNACKGIPTEALEYQSIIGLVEEMALLVKSAIARVNLANRGGDPILLAWREAAEAAVSKAEKLKHYRS